MPDTPMGAPSFRAFGDAPTTRKLIFDNVFNAATALQPVKNQQHTLQLADIGYEGPEEYSKQDVKQAVLRGTSLTRRLRGTWQLTDNATGQPIAERRTTLANVPYLTDDGLFINRGVGYTLANQLRLSPGVFARKKQNGELEAHVNVLPGKGRGHRIFMDPASGVFKLNMAQANMPLYPLLRAMGATDQQLRETWGNDLAGINAAKNDGSVIRKLYERVARNRVEGADPETMAKAVAESFGGMELDDFVTNRTLQHKSPKLDLQTMLATTKKLLAINRGEAEPDDRDHMAYQHVLGPEDLLAERLGKSGGELRKLLWKVSARKNLDGVQPGFFDRAIQSAIIGSGLGAPIEEINPAEIFDQQSRLTRMGEGGISSLDAVPEESRAVQPTHLGFVDFLRTPECYDEHTEVMTRRGWVFWPAVQADDEFACLVDGCLTFSRAMQLIRQPYAGPMYGADTGRISYLVTPNHRLWVSPQFKGAQYRIETAETCHGRFRRVCSGGFAPYVGEALETFSLPTLLQRSNNEQVVTDVPISEWAELVGWWLGEGNSRYVESASSYYIKITQSRDANPENCDRITSLLRSLPFAWSYSDCAFTIATKQIAAYFSQFGGSASRYIPEELLAAPVASRLRLYRALLFAEGRRDRSGDRTQFCTTSERLADDFVRLAFSLGIATRKVFEPDLRPQANYGGAWVVHVHKQNEHQLLPRSSRGNDYFTLDFSGEVFCATVPGGLLYVRRGDTIGHWSGNSGKVGVDMRLARGAVKGSDGFLYFPLKNAKTGQTEYKSARDLADAVIAFEPVPQAPVNPNGPTPPARQFWSGNGRKTQPVQYGGNTYVNAISGGKMRFERSDKIDYVLPAIEDTFSPLANMIPLKSMVKGQRAVMAARMVTQALPLQDGEAPLVQSAMPENPERSFEEEYSKHMGAVRAEQPASVVSVDNNAIVLKHADGSKKRIDLYDNMPYNRKSVTGRTRVWVRRGDTYWEGPIADYVPHDSDDVLSVDPATKKSKWCRITGFVRHDNDKQLVRVHTASGRSVEITIDHSLVTLDATGSLVPIYPADVVINRTRLPVALLPIDGTEQVSDDLATMAGLYLSEGHLPEQAGLVMIAAEPPAHVEQIMQLAMRLGFSPYRAGGGVCFTDHAFRAWLLSKFGQTSGGKFIATDIFGWKSNARQALLRGYFAGDGCLWADAGGAIQVQAVSTSRRLRDRLVALAASLGIFSTLFDAPRKHLNENWSDAYGFRVISGHLAKLPRWFFYDDRERLFQQLLKSTYRASPYELVPIVSKQARRTLYAELPKTSHYIHKTAGKGAVAKHRLVPGVGNFGKWGQSDVMWDTVVAIELIPHEQHVFDFCVAESEVFGVDHGLIVHNTLITQTATVKPGDVVQPGQLLARSNYTDAQGVTALGKNLRVAYLPFRGANFEDANVISESAAKRLSSEHAYQHVAEWGPDVRRGKRAFLANFPGKFHKSVLEQFDDEGLIKPGTKVGYGDPLVLSVSERARTHGAIHRGRRPEVIDSTLTWDHHTPGVVTDVVNTDKGATVVVKATVPAEVGDKLCFDEETEVLTKAGWKSVAAVTTADLICTLQAGDRVVYLSPTAVHRYATGGLMYRIKSQQIDQFVTASHRMYVKRRNASEFELVQAQDLFGQRVSYKKDGHWVGRTPKSVRIRGPVVAAGQAGRGSRKLADLVLSTTSYMTLLGAFVAEGNLVDQPKHGSYGIDITQIKEPNRGELLAELSRLGIKYNTHGRGTKLRIYSKALLAHFREFGSTAGEKRLPNRIFSWAAGDLRTLFRWLMWGDGHTHETGRPVCYTTTSPQLADDVQRLCLHIGYAANVVNELPATTQVIKGKAYECLPRYSVRVITAKLTPTVNHGHSKTQTAQEEYLVKDYDRPVYCVTVPGHVLYVRRNGKPCWSGNSGRYGDKGVISMIVPDDEMPTDDKGKAYEILTNPLGVISRVNSAQMIEAALGKVAAVTGKPYKVPFRTSQDAIEYAMSELRKNNLSDLDSVIDPETGKKIPNVFAGNRWFMKLHHTAEAKAQGRGIGGYTSEGAPAKGGESGAKRVGMLNLGALLSHGAGKVIREAKMIRGQANPEFWSQFMSGYKPATPRIPKTYEKFIGMLQGSGIHPVRQGTRTQLMAMSNDKIDELTGGREIQNTETVDWKNGLKPKRGGLFDETITGGHEGTRWSAIRLHEPMPNPVMEEPIRRVLGLTENKMRDVLAGREAIHGISGPQGIVHALENIDLGREIEQTRLALKSSRKTQRDEAIRKFGFLTAAARTGVHPKDWVMNKVPVLPPRFRPVTTMGAKKLPLVADANYLYKELFDANDVLKQMSGKVDDVGDERLATYDAMKAVAGLGEPQHPKNQERGVKGLLKQIFGCYDDRTEILTADGWKQFESLPPGIPVGTLNQTTGAFEWQIPTDYHKYRYIGELAEIKLGKYPRVDLLVTPNHRNWVRNRARVADEKLQDGWEIEEAYRTVTDTGRKWFQTAAFAWHGHTKLPSFVPAICSGEDFAAIVGWWVAEGWIHSDGKAVELCQERHRNGHKCDQIEATLRRSGFRFTSHTYDGRGKEGKTDTRQWSIKDAELATWLQEHCGRLAGTKQLSQFIKDWDSSLLRSLLLAYLGGDGEARVAKKGAKKTHKYRSELTDDFSRLGTTSARLYDDMAEVCCKLGLTLRPNTDGNGKQNQAALYRGAVSGQATTVQEGSTGKRFVAYDGYVYCVTVPNGVVFVRRNGIPVFSGNSSPKFGMIQRKLLSTTTDLVGRATITPNPDLDMDSVGLPEDKAWELYTPYTVRNLVRRGMPRLQAAQLVKNKHPVAREALVKEMGQRPVMIDRAPVLHRYGVMAFWPQITRGHTMQISPLVVGGFNADFDGDAMQFHLPADDEAAQEMAEKMLPSKNLFSVARFRTHFLPSQEYVGGLYHATSRIDARNSPAVFETQADAIRAYQAGQISADRRVRILRDK